MDERLTVCLAGNRSLPQCRIGRNIRSAETPVGQDSAPAPSTWAPGSSVKLVRDAPT